MNRRVSTRKIERMKEFKEAYVKAKEQGLVKTYELRRDKARKA